MRYLKLFEAFVKTERALKSGFHIANLSNGDTVEKGGKEWTVTSVGADSFWAKQGSLRMQQEFKSLKDFKPVKVKSMNESMVKYTTLTHEDGKMAQDTLNGLGIENSLIPAKGGLKQEFGADTQLYDLMIDDEKMKSEDEKTKIKNALEYLEGDDEDTDINPTEYED